MTDNNDSTPCMGSLPTAEFLNECFDADFKDGILKWKTRPQRHFKSARSFKAWNKQWPGAIAGGPHKAGYVAVTVNAYGHRHVLLAHRILWCMRTGNWPQSTLDHRNLCRTDNGQENLREASYGQQSANRKAMRSGIKGATLDKRTGRYLAQITTQGRNIFLGRFKTEKEAGDAYANAARRLHGEFARAE